MDEGGDLLAGPGDRRGNPPVAPCTARDALEDRPGAILIALEAVVQPAVGSVRRLARQPGENTHPAALAPRVPRVVVPRRRARLAETEAAEAGEGARARQPERGAAPDRRREIGP